MDLKMSIVLDVTEVILMFTQHWQVLEGHMECDGRTRGGAACHPDCGEECTGVK